MAATPAPQLPVVFTSDLSTTSFTKDANGKWTFVQGATTAISTDAGNIAAVGTDKGILVTPAAVKGAQNYPSISVTNGTVTHNDGAGHITTFALGQQDVHVSGMSLIGTVLHLQNNDGSPDETLDLGKFLMTVATANGQGAAVSGAGTQASPLTVAVVLDPSNDNLATLSVSGVMVSKAAILALLVANTTLSSAANTLTLSINGQPKTAPIINTLTITMDAANGVAHVTANGVDATIPIVEITDSSGTHRYFAFA